jgi:hypothetical protein
VRLPFSDCELRVAHSCGFSSVRDFLFSIRFFRRPNPIRLFIARGEFRVGEKPAPFTKTVKGAAPENSTTSKTWPTRHHLGGRRTISTEQWA